MDTARENLRRLSLVLALALVLLPGHAHAQQGEFNLDFGPGFYALGIGLAAITLGSGAFLVGDVVLAAQGRWLPPAAAAIELLLVGVPWFVLGAIFLGDLDDEGAGIAMCALGVGFSAHAIASMTLDQSEHARVRAGPALALSPWLGRGVAGAGVAARF